MLEFKGVVRTSHSVRWTATVGGGGGEGVCERDSSTQATPSHTRQDAEADFLGGLIERGGAMSHSQNAMEFCWSREPSTIWGGKRMQTEPDTQADRWGQKRKEMKKESREGNMHRKKKRLKRKMKICIQRDTEKIYSCSASEVRWACRGRVPRSSSTSFRSLSAFRCSVCCVLWSFLRCAVAVLWNHLEIKNVQFGLFLQLVGHSTEETP